ncbi:MAG: hypothetical protein JSS72_01200 [Armatimonadetes bacterium]|nr:hypothetical protein [Armatimonadota bacterium]
MKILLFLLISAKLAAAQFVPLELHTFAAFYPVAIDPTGKFLAAATWQQGPLVVKEFGGGEQVLEQKGDAFELAWSHDGRYLTSISTSHRVRVWDVRHKRCLLTAVTTAQYAPRVANDRLAIVDGSEIDLVSLMGGKITNKLRIPEGRQVKMLTDCGSYLFVMLGARGPDGPQLAKIGAAKGDLTLLASPPGSFGGISEEDTGTWTYIALPPLPKVGNDTEKYFADANKLEASVWELDPALCRISMLGKVKPYDSRPLGMLDGQTLAYVGTDANGGVRVILKSFKTGHEETLLEWPRPDGFLKGAVSRRTKTIVLSQKGSLLLWRPR